MIKQESEAILCKRHFLIRQGYEFERILHLKIIKLQSFRNFLRYYSVV